MFGIDRPTALLASGVALLLVGAALFYLSVPTYVTQIDRTAPNERSMANATAAYDASEIDVVPFGELSPAERAAFEGAHRSPENRYTDRGGSDGGTVFEYRNDVVNTYFVEYDGNVYAVTVVVDIHPLVRGASVLSAAAGLPLFAFGLRRR